MSEPPSRESADLLYWNIIVDFLSSNSKDEDVLVALVDIVALHGLPSSDVLEILLAAMLNTKLCHAVSKFFDRVQERHVPDMDGLLATGLLYS